jgi:hypothetical protein
VSELVRTVTERLVRLDREHEHLLEYAVILVLIGIVTALSLAFLGDAIADLVSLIGGQAERAPLTR